MDWEYCALFLAHQGGAEGQRLASAIGDETERIFAAQEREQLEGASRKSTLHRVQRTSLDRSQSAAAGSSIVPSATASINRTTSA